MKKYILMRTMSNETGFESTTVVKTVLKDTFEDAYKKLEDFVNISLRKYPDGNVIKLDNKSTMVQFTRNVLYGEETIVKEHGRIIYSIEELMV